MYEAHCLLVPLTQQQQQQQLQLQLLLLTLLCANNLDGFKRASHC